MSEENKKSLIYGQMSEVLADVEAIEKERKNTQGTGYHFRGIDDVYNAMHPLFAKHGVFCVPIVLNVVREDRETRTGTAMIYTMLTVKYVFYAIDGSSVEATVVGEAFDTGDKSANKAMSAAMKYAILQTFCIPTREDKDTETYSPEVKSREPKSDAAKSPQAQTKDSNKSVTEPQIKRLYAIVGKRADAGWTKETVEEVAIAAFGIKESFKELAMGPYDKLCGWIENMSYAETVDKILAWKAEKAKTQPTQEGMF